MQPRSGWAAVLVLLVVPSLLCISAQLPAAATAAVDVGSGQQLYAALSDPNVTDITLVNDVDLRGSAFEDAHINGSLKAVVLRRNVSVRGQPGVMPVINWRFLLNIIELGPGTNLAFEYVTMQRMISELHACMHLRGGWMGAHGHPCTHIAGAFTARWPM